MYLPHHSHHSLTITSLLEHFNKLRNTYTHEIKIFYEDLIQNFQKFLGQPTKHLFLVILLF